MEIGCDVPVEGYVYRARQHESLAIKNFDFKLTTGRIDCNPVARYETGPSCGEDSGTRAAAAGLREDAWTFIDDEPDRIWAGNFGHADICLLGR